MDQIRAFIAIELPGQIQNKLADIIGRLSPGLESAVKWVNPESIHLTLKFLGNISKNRVPIVTAAMTAAAGKSGIFTLEAKGLGAFPNLKSPRVVWVGLGGDIAGIRLLHKEIDVFVAPLGFPPETREFSPHLTLGRIRDRATQNEKYQLGRAISSIQAENLGFIYVENIHLMQSTLTKTGALYNFLATVSLDRKAQR